MEPFGPDGDQHKKKQDMTQITRKAAVAAYRERKITAGIYAIRCTASDQVWIGSAPDLSTIENRLWFTLRQGANPHRSLQETWNAHGRAVLTFTVIAHLRDEDDPGYPRRRALKELHQRWLNELGGTRI